MAFHEWLIAKEGIWLFYVLIAGLFAETLMVIFQTIEIRWARKEFEYDEQKDLAKAQRKTKTSKKTTQSKDGGTTVEETTETTEPVSPGGPQGKGQ
jgi:hypothetical protein